jgi:hypothetical protein
MNRDELHDALSQLVALDETPTAVQAIAFRRRAIRRRLLRRGMTVGLFGFAVMGAAVALARKHTALQRVAAVPANTPTTSPHTRTTRRRSDPVT